MDSNRPPLISTTDSGLYCAEGDFYIDAWKPVPRTVVTHAHSDHAYAGSGRYLASAEGECVLRKRIGSDAPIDALAYGESIDLGGVKISLHPAGHVLGSAQVRVENAGEVWVVTGDYKRQHDATCSPFELVPCHTLITECTFGLPIFRWRETAEIAGEINGWWQNNIALGRTSLLLAYSLGKAQRVLSLLDPSLGPILLHGAVHAMTEAYRTCGVALPPAEYATAERAKETRGKALVICPPGAADTIWARKFSPVSIGVASGWMQVRGFRRRRSADMGFVLSDHVDWPALLQTIAETGAQRVIATHGYTAQLSRYLSEKGLEAGIYHTRFTDAGEEEQLIAEEA
ncbi:MAG TPA: ligase-associated DNA damage response exonuclease [Tepidisphaeraceae bacterium]|nr:ligase-associated DNA damage response exonuclease [Tepidisphaeraceae bacterium]